MNDEKPVKLSARLPKQSNLNGLDTVHDTLRRYGTAIIVMQVTAHERAERVGGIVQPTAVIEWVEGLPGGKRGTLGDIGAKLLHVARVDRTGADEDTLVSRADLLGDLRRYLDAEEDADQAD
jgi:hypothetical protein